MSGQQPSEKKIHIDHPQFVTPTVSRSGNKKRTTAFEGTFLYNQNQNNYQQDPIYKKSAPEQKSTNAGYLRWIETFIKTLFDFSFSEVITVKMLPLLYSLAITALVVTLGYITIETILESPIKGLALLIFIDPLLFIIGTAFVRTILEFCASLFKVQSLMIEMTQGVKKVEVKLDQLVVKLDSMGNHLGDMSESISDMRDNFKSVTRVAENLDGMREKIPFIKKPKKEDRKNWAESSISERFQYSTRSFYRIDE